VRRGRIVEGGRETVKRKRKLSAGFLQPIQNPSYMSHVLLLCILTFICLRATSLSYDVAHRTVTS
jgi:hypothetical protein